MNDAISRSAVMEAALTKLTLGKRVDGVPVLRETITAKELDTLLADAPALDVAPVVRCKDCRRWGCDLTIETEHIKCCKLAGYMVGENGYCVYGERSDDHEPCP